MKMENLYDLNTIIGLDYNLSITDTVLYKAIHNIGRKIEIRNDEINAIDEVITFLTDAIAGAKPMIYEKNKIVKSGATDIEHLEALYFLFLAFSKIEEKMISPRIEDFKNKIENYRDVLIALKENKSVSLEKKEEVESADYFISKLSAFTEEEIENKTIETMEIAGIELK